MNILSFLPRLRSDRRGVAALEFALIGPVLLIMIGGMVDLGLSVRARSHLAQGLTSAAQYAFKVGASVTAASLTSMVQGASGLSGVTVVVTGPGLYCVSGSPAALVSGTLGVACGDGTQPGTYVKIAATYTYVQITPLLSKFLNTSLQQNVTVRLQ